MGVLAMTFFNPELIKKGRVRVGIQKIWFFYIWWVTYSSHDLFDRWGFVRSEESGLDKSLVVVERIRDYENQGLKSDAT